MKMEFYSPLLYPRRVVGSDRFGIYEYWIRPLTWLPFRMLIQKHMLMCIRYQDWSAAIGPKDEYVHVSILPVSTVCLCRGAYQYKVLPFVLSLSPCIFTEVADCPCLLEGSGHSHPQRLANPSSLLRVVHTGTWSSSTGTSGQLAKEQAHLFFIFVSVELNCKELNCHNESMSFRKLCSLSAELIELFQAQNSGPSQIFPEAPGAYGILSRGNAKDGHGAAAHITWSSHWGDVAHSALGWTFLFYRQEFPRTSVHMCSCYNRHIQDRHRVQRVWLYYQVPERCAEVKFSETVPHPLLGSLGGLTGPTERFIWAFTVSRAQCPLYEDDPPDCANLGQEGGRPTSPLS